MPWRTEEDGTRSFVIWADLLAAQGYAVEDLVRQLLRDLGKEHRVVGWEHSADVPAGTELEIELVDDSEDTAVRSVLLRLARSTPGVERLELLDRDPLDRPHEV